MKRSALALVLGGALALLGGCSGGNDACKGVNETCLSLTLMGTEGVTQADQLEVLLSRQTKGRNPMMALGSPQDLPVKVAVLWPDGGATISVRSFVAGVLTGVSAELTLDLRGGAHAKRALTLYPPIAGPTPADLAGRDLATPPPPDLATPDLATPDLATPDMATPDLATPDLAPFG